MAKIGRPKGSHDIASEIRGGFIRALKSREDRKKKSLAELIEESLDERFLDTLKAISAYVPKEMLIDADITTQMDEMSDEAINAEIKRLAGQAGSLFAALGEAEETQH